MGELPPLTPETANFKTVAAERLTAEWSQLYEGAETPSISTPDDVRAAIIRCINSKTKTYRYVLPTQVLAKVVRPELNCHAIQATAKIDGAFDARSLCHSVVVPFDQANENVLGGADAPYLSNPLRIPVIGPSTRSGQKDKKGFDDLNLVLDHLEAQPNRAPEIFKLVLGAVRERLATVRVVYPVPNRVSHAAAVKCIAEFLQEKTGGIRLQAVAVGLFRAIGEIYGIFGDVRSNNVNAADASTGSAADLECVAVSGEIVKAVEVKDRALALIHVQSKLPSIREKGISEAIFVVQGGAVLEEKSQIDELIRKEFGSGQNIYVVDFNAFLKDHLVVFAEEGRRRFLQFVGTELDLRKADVAHRQKWRDLLLAI